LEQSINDKIAEIKHQMDYSQERAATRKKAGNTKAGKYVL